MRIRTKNVMDLQHCPKPQKNINCVEELREFFCLLLFKAAFTSFFKKIKSRKSHKGVHKTIVQSRFFLLFLLDYRRIRIRIREAQKHTDPDPQH
jgi:hypothetical protein